LFLASASLPGKVEELTDLVGPHARVGVSANALDVAPRRERDEWLEREIRALGGAGLSPIELDLREYYAHPEAIVEVASALDMVWATGGNVFVLRKAFRRSGFDRLLLARLDDNSLAYGGCSAGACICGSTLRGIELIDDAHAAGPPIFEGLGLLDYSIAPHFGADGEIGQAILRLTRHFEETGTPYRALRDGQAIVVHDESSTMIEFH
jgi:dipeptidase E